MKLIIMAQEMQSYDILYFAVSYVKVKALFCDKIYCLRSNDNLLKATKSDIPVVQGNSRSDNGIPFTVKSW